MRIAVLNLTRGGMSRGYRKYLKNLIPRMAANPEVESLLCACPSRMGIGDDLGGLPNVRCITCEPYPLLPWHTDTELCRVLVSYMPDVIFIPMERYLTVGTIPVITMVHNMLPMSSIRCRPLHERIRNLIQGIIARRAVKKSDRVIAVSEYVKDVICAQWEIPRERIGVVYHGIDAPLSGSGEKPEIIPHEWRGGFLFTAGSIDPHRGLEDVISAMGLLRGCGVDVRLVIAGGTRRAMRGYRMRLEKLVEYDQGVDRILWAGDLAERQVAWCYDNCRIFVMTSRVEACPNIALEAMAHGCVCIVADNPPLPEFFKDSALYYTPGRADTLAGLIKEAFSWGGGRIRTTSERARERASLFSWDMTVSTTLGELKRVVEGTRYAGHGFVCPGGVRGETARRAL
jgi:glycosyltransferase involved in cell wall biosynthesis